MTYRLNLRGTPDAAREYDCPEHGAFDLIVDLATSRTPRPCPTCAAPSERTLTTNIVARASYTSFTRGKSDAPPPGVLTTEAIANGMPVSEFRAKRRAMWRDRDRATAKSKGMI